MASTHLVPVTVLALLPFAALAQTAPADTARFYRHHLGLVASPVLDHFFTANRALPVGLLYKRETKPGRLWRYGLVLNQDYSSQKDYRPDYAPANNLIKLNPEYSNSAFGASISVGREYTNRFAQRWVGTVGADISVGFSQYTNRSSYQLPSNLSVNLPTREEVVGNRYRYYEMSISPFAGLRFYCWPRLYVSAESALQFYYLRNTHSGLSYVADLATGQTLLGDTDFSDAQVRQQGMSVHYRLINQLTVHYLLGRR